MARFDWETQQAETQYKNNLNNCPKKPEEYATGYF
jgi:hypothetical protein